MSEPPVLQSALLAAQPGVEHAFFTRLGGVSTGLYSSLNVGFGSGDDPAAVRENRARAAQGLGVAPDRLVTVYQTHSAAAVLAERPWSVEPPRADAIVSGQRGLALGALSADCAPVLIADAQARVVAAVHAGWRGALAGVVQAAVDLMVHAGGRPASMVAAVGPCIGPASYEVGAEFEAEFLARDGSFGRFFQAGVTAEKRQFDLPAFVLSRLAAAGVRQAEWIGADTCADEKNFFSNRRAVKAGEGDYGRLLSAIVLR